MNIQSSSFDGVIEQMKMILCSPGCSGESS